MKKLGKTLRPLVIFYIVLAYVLASFSWWTYLHMKNMEDISSLKTEVQQLRSEKLNPGHNLTNYTKGEIVEEYQRKKRMIASEGIVFLLLLLFGSYKIHAGIQKELALNRRQRNFLLSITHELKSPLASIKLNVETMIKRQLERAQQFRLLTNSLKSTKRLETLVENILMAAKIENQEITFAKENNNLTTTVQEITEQVENALNNSHNFELELTPNIYINGDRMALVSIINNLVENATKYSPKGTNITVSLTSEGKMARLKVADEGDGVKNNEKQKIFEKFYRTGDENKRRTKGTGLGLYLVKQLVEFHKGTIKVIDNDPKGSIFIVELPRNVVSKPQLRSIKASA